MKKQKISLIAVAAVICAISAGQSHAQNWVVELNYANVDDTSGAELGFGRDFGNSRFRVTPQLGLFVYQGDNDRYYIDTFSNGTERCRDSQTGQFADDSRCNNSETKAYGKLEGAVTLGQSWELGIGARFSDDTTPYGLITKKFSGNGLVKAFAGEDYYAVGFGLKF